MGRYTSHVEAETITDNGFIDHILNVKFHRCEPSQLERKGHVGVAVYASFAEYYYAGSVVWEGGEK